MRLVVLSAVVLFTLPACAQTAPSTDSGVVHFKASNGERESYLRSC